jgi:hypothetical protein
MQCLGSLGQLIAEQLAPSEWNRTQQWRHYEPIQETSNCDSSTHDGGFGAQSALGRIGGMG